MCVYYSNNFWSLISVHTAVVWGRGKHNGWVLHTRTFLQCLWSNIHMMITAIRGSTEFRLTSTVGWSHHGEITYPNHCHHQHHWSSVHCSVLELTKQLDEMSKAVNSFASDLGWSSAWWQWHPMRIMRAQP